MSLRYLADSEAGCKPVHRRCRVINVGDYTTDSLHPALASALEAPRRAGPMRDAGPEGGSGRPPGPPLERFAALAGGGPVLLMTARFGRSPVRDAAYRFRAQRVDLDLRPAWRLFANLEDWGKRWPTKLGTFAAGLILSAADDPIVERAVGRCLADLARRGRPLLWGATGQPVRWHPRFVMSPNGWTPDRILPHPATYARLAVAHDIADFRPAFDPILFSADPDFFIFDTRLRWRDTRDFDWVTPYG
jgi:hypothetical protein